MIKYGRGILSRTYWLLRMRSWLWREKRTVVRLKTLIVLLGADELLPRQAAADSSFEKYTPKVAGDLQSQPLLFGDGENIIKARSGEQSLEDESLCWEDAGRALRERKVQLIAEYDAHFLASLRIKSSVPRYR